jgi:hypothetical protein
MEEKLTRVDHSAIRTNQSFIIGLLLLAFILDFPWLVGGVAAVMLAGSLLHRPGFGWIYARLFKPMGWIKPDVLMDNPEPHLFAQGFGGIVLAAAGVIFILGAPVVGWVLAWLVVALAALNLFAWFCVGCAIYYWLNRLHAPGFIKNPPTGTFPGMRPKSRA